MTDDIEHFSVCLFVIFISSLEKYPSMSTAHFLIGLFIFIMLSFERFLNTYVYIYTHTHTYFLDASLLSDMWFANTFSQSVDCLFF